MGELERMRTQLLKSLREFSSSLQEPWGRPLIARNVARLALASDDPTGAVTKFWQELTTMEPASRTVMHQAIADALRDAAIVLGKRRSYCSAARAGFASLYHDPRQIFEMDLLKRFLRALYQYLNSRVREHGGRPISWLAALLCT
jgi:hypothetical protein